MECVCGAIFIAALLGTGFYRLSFPFHAWLFGVVDEGYDEEDEFDDNEFTDEELYCTDGELEEWGCEEDLEREPVDVRALLESSLPGPDYRLFHDVTFTPAGEKEPRQIDHIVACRHGVFCIQTLQLEGEILADTDVESDWGVRVNEGRNLEWIPSPVGVIRRTARRLARSLGLEPSQVVGIVAQAGKGWFEDGCKTPGSYYASDLLQTFERRKKVRLSAEEIEQVCERLREGLK